MLLLLTFSSINATNIILSFHYEENIQAFLYNIIEDKKFSKFLHHKGYKCGKRSYKMFSFSKVLDKAIEINKSDKKFIFDKEITIAVSTIENEFFNSIFQSILHNKDTLFIGQNKVNIIKISTCDFEIKNSYIVKTLSPICCYSTAKMADGRNRTIYFNPRERDFSRIIRENLIRKYEALYEKKPEDDNFSINIKGYAKEKIVTFKGVIIKAYNGIFELNGSKELMKIAFDSGLGSKNSQGFGTICPNNISTGGNCYGNT